MTSKVETATLLYLATWGRDAPTGIAEYTGGNKDYLRNVVVKLHNRGLLGQHYRGHYWVTDEGLDELCSETGLSSGEILAARILRSHDGDAILGNHEEMVVRYGSGTFVVYRVGLSDSEEMLAFEPKQSIREEELEERLDAAMPEL